MIKYDGICSLCGHAGLFQASRESRFPAREFPCAACGAALRFRDEAAVLVEELGFGRHLSLRTLVRDERTWELAVYHVGIAGRTREWLSQLPRYVESTYWEKDTPLALRNQATHQDLQALSFTDAAFDVVFSSHVMEHVPDPRQAFREVYRVLRPGGCYILSIPIPWPPPEQSVVRCRNRNGRIEHFKDPVYHDSPGGKPSLVYTDFGLDLLRETRELGFHPSIRRPHICVDFAYRSCVIVCRRHT